MNNSIIKKKFLEVNKRIRTLNPDSRLVAVTKGRSVEEIKEIIGVGAQIIGENRVQEAAAKFAELEVEEIKIEKHLIGHLQRNKVRLAVTLFDLIQSVDSLRLIEKLEFEAGRIKKIIPIYLQVNAANDRGKYGFKIDEVPVACEEIRKCPHLALVGLMTIGGFNANNLELGSSFEKMKNLFDILSVRGFFNSRRPQLSMGMSNDYQLALKKGSTMVRIGSDLFS